MKLEILICTIPKRVGMFESLVAAINKQGCSFLSDDDPQISVGVKRQRLLERASGEYIAFVDDDDRLSADYVARVLGVLEKAPDCVGMQGLITMNGGPAALFEHSMRHQSWYEKGGVYYRYPNHLNPVRRELALQAGFRDMTYGEDKDYSDRLLPLLHTEEFLKGPIYFYDCRSNK